MAKSYATKNERLNATLRWPFSIYKAHEVAVRVPARRGSGMPYKKEAIEQKRKNCRAASKRYRARKKERRRLEALRLQQLAAAGAGGGQQEDVQAPAEVQQPGSGGDLGPGHGRGSSNNRVQQAQGLQLPRSHGGHQPVVAGGSGNQAGAGPQGVQPVDDPHVAGDEAEQELPPAAGGGDNEDIASRPGPSGLQQQHSGEVRAQGQDSVADGPLDPQNGGPPQQQVDGADLPHMDLSSSSSDEGGSVGSGASIHAADSAERAGASGTDDEPVAPDAGRPDRTEDAQQEMMASLHKLHSTLAKKHAVSLRARQTVQGWLWKNAENMQRWQAMGAKMPKSAVHMRQTQIAKLPTVKTRVYIRVPDVDDRGQMIQVEAFQGEYEVVPMHVQSMDIYRRVSYIPLKEAVAFSKSLHEGRCRNAIDWTRPDFSCDGVPHAKSATSRFYVVSLVWPGCGFPVIYMLHHCDYGWSPTPDEKIIGFKDDLATLGMTVRYFRADCPERHDFLRLVRRHKP